MRSIQSCLSRLGQRSMGAVAKSIGQRILSADGSPAGARGWIARLARPCQPVALRWLGPKLRLELLEARQLLAANPLITEIMADNGDNLGLGPVETAFGKADPFGDGSTPDWIEIFNAGDEALDLAGYHLTDDKLQLTRWTFPSVTLPAGGYLLVYATAHGGAQPSDYVDSEGRLHTNFGLSNDGEYLVLVAPDGTTVLSELGIDGRGYPDQLQDVSYGYMQTSPLLNTHSDVAYWVPLNGNAGTSWTQVGFDAAANGFSAGKAALGYEDKPTDRTNFVAHSRLNCPPTFTGRLSVPSSRRAMQRPFPACCCA